MDDTSPAPRHFSLAILLAPLFSAQYSCSLTSVSAHETCFKPPLPWASATPERWLCSPFVNSCATDTISPRREIEIETPPPKNYLCCWVCQIILTKIIRYLSISTVNLWNVWLPYWSGLQQPLINITWMSRCINTWSARCTCSWPVIFLLRKEKSNVLNRMTEMLLSGQCCVCRSFFSFQHFSLSTWQNIRWWRSVLCLSSTLCIVTLNKQNITEMPATTNMLQPRTLSCLRLPVSYQRPLSSPRASKHSGICFLAKLCANEVLCLCVLDHLDGVISLQAMLPPYPVEPVKVREERGWREAWGIKRTER